MAIPAYVECVYPHQAWFAKASATQRAKPEFVQVRAAFDTFRASIAAVDANALPDNQMIDEYVHHINIYKDFADALPIKVAFSAQTKFHSTIMEEFWTYLLGEQLTRMKLVPVEQGQILFMGSGAALQSTFFGPHSLSALLNVQQQTDPWFQVRTKDRDFMIARRARIAVTVDGVEVNERTGAGTYRLLSERASLLPLVTIECKQYVDKTMLDNAMAAADHRRLTTPSCLDLIAVELNKLSDWNIGGSGLDNLFLLRKQRLVDAAFIGGTGPKDTVDVARRNPIDSAVVKKIYRCVESHLNAPYWRASEAELLATGVALHV